MYIWTYMAPRQCWQWPLYWVERVVTPPPSYTGSTQCLPAPKWSEGGWLPVQTDCDRHQGTERLHTGVCGGQSRLACVLVAWMHTYVYMYVCTYVCMYCMYVCMYVYVRICRRHLFVVDQVWLISVYCLWHVTLCALVESTNPPVAKAGNNSVRLLMCVCVHACKCEHGWKYDICIYVIGACVRIWVSVNHCLWIWTIANDCMLYDVHMYIHT